MLKYILNKSIASNFLFLFLFFNNCYLSHSPSEQEDDIVVADSCCNDVNSSDEIIQDYVDINDSNDINYDYQIDSQNKIPPEAILLLSSNSISIEDTITAYGDSSYDLDGNIVLYEFDWGDGSGITQNSSGTAEHQYNNSGTYIITLTVHDNDNLSDSVQSTIVVSTTTCYGSEDCAIDEICNNNGQCVALPPQKCSREQDCLQWARTCRYFPASDTGGENLPLACQRPVTGGLSSGSSCDQYRRNNVCYNELCNIGLTCSVACTEDSDCEDGLVCKKQLFSVNENKGQYFNGCVPLFSKTSTPGLVDITHLPDLEITTPTEESQPITLSVNNSDDVSMTIVAYSADNIYEIVGPHKLVSPNNETLFDYNMLWYEQKLPPLVYIYYEYIVSLGIPNSPLHTLTSGNYSLTMRREYFSGNLTMYQHNMHREGRILNLNIFLVVPQIRAATAQYDQNLQQYLTKMAQIYSQAGLEIGQITYHDVVGLPQNRYLYIDTLVGANSELADLFSLSAGVDSSGVNIFIVQDIADAVGIAGAISGPPGYNGTINSGIAIGVEYLDYYDGGIVLAHEVGHYLGLFHTTEYNGSNYENIPDTPVCDVSNDLDGDGYVMVEECLNFGGNNLMFWSGQSDYLSEGQGFVMKRFASLEE